MSACIEVLKGGTWYLRVVDGKNDKTLLHSESYYSKWNAKRAARKLSRQFGIPYVVAE
jgi:uncharacterized protein YegP (UPF0339 family)